MVALRSRVIRLIAGLVIASVAVDAAGAGDELPHRPGWRDDFRRPVAVPYPEYNPYSAEKATLGATLFSDPVLSVSRDSACVTCHRPGLAWGDGLARAVGDRQQPMALRSPTLLDVAWTPRLGWDGKFADVEAVTFPAISGKASLNLPVQDALERLSASPAYLGRLQAAFGPGRITQQKVERALATYERGIVSSPAPFDRWAAGDEQGASGAAKRGFALFDGKAGCSGCHSGWAFTNYSFRTLSRGRRSRAGGAAFQRRSAHSRAGKGRRLEGAQAAHDLLDMVHTHGEMKPIQDVFHWAARGRAHQRRQGGIAVADRGDRDALPPALVLQRRAQQGMLAWAC